MSGVFDSTLAPGYPTQPASLAEHWPGSEPQAGQPAIDQSVDQAHAAIQKPTGFGSSVRWHFDRFQMLASTELRLQLSRIAHDSFDVRHLDRFIPSAIADGFVLLSGISCFGAPIASERDSLAA